MRTYFRYRQFFCRHHHLDKSGELSTLIANGQWKRFTYPWKGIDSECDAEQLETYAPTVITSHPSKCYFKSAATRPSCIRQCINPSCPTGYQRSGICSGYARSACAPRSASLGVLLAACLCLCPVLLVLPLHVPPTCPVRRCETAGCCDAAAANILLT